jgi:glucosamine kinase
MLIPPVSADNAKRIPIVQQIFRHAENLPSTKEPLPFWYSFGMVRGKGIAMTLYLGVDGGGSGCRAAVADAAGHVLGRGEAAAANIWTDPEGARGNILAAAQAALDAAGRGSLAELHAVLGLAGANVPAARARLAELLPFARARIESDALVALKGALGDEDGITAALGTGSIFGVQRGGAVRMVGGWGFLLGDQGSGARMGRALCEAALLAHDGLRPTSALLEATIAEAGGPAALVAWGQGARPADFARAAPRILAAAAAGDAGAATVVAEAEAAVAQAIDRLIADGGPVPICFLGGLGRVFAERLAGRYAGLVRAPRGTGLDGALLLARALA